MSVTEANFALPSDPEGLKRIKNAVEEIVAQERMIQDRREGIKDVKVMLKEEFEMPPSLTGKLVKAFHDDDYQDIQAANSQFELVRESVLGAGDGGDDTSTDAG
mgnify:CR=1 FL=1